MKAGQQPMWDLAFVDKVLMLMAQLPPYARWPRGSTMGLYGDDLQSALLRIEDQKQRWHDTPSPKEFLSSLGMRTFERVSELIDRKLPRSYNRNQCEADSPESERRRYRNRGWLQEMTIPLRGRENPLINLVRCGDFCPECMTTAFRALRQLRPLLADATDWAEEQPVEKYASSGSRACEVKIPGSGVPAACGTTPALPETYRTLDGKEELFDRETMVTSTEICTEWGKRSSHIGRWKEAKTRARLEPIGTTLTGAEVFNRQAAMEHRIFTEARSTSRHARKDAACKKRNRA